MVASVVNCITVDGVVVYCIMGRMDGVVVYCDGVVVYCIMGRMDGVVVYCIVVWMQSSTK